MTFWQIDVSMAIMASVLAGRQIGVRGHGIASAGFTLLAISYGISFASSSFNALNKEKMVTFLLPLIPTIFLISFCQLFPLWLRYGSFIACLPFFFI